MATTSEHLVVRDTTKAQDLFVIDRRLSRQRRVIVTGDIYATGDVIGRSDARAKEDIREIGDALGRVGRIRGVTFSRVGEAASGRRHAGVIAQEVAEELPEVVYVDEATGEHSVAYGNLTALLIQALREETAARRALEARVEALESLRGAGPA